MIRDTAEGARVAARSRSAYVSASVPVNQKRMPSRGCWRRTRPAFHEAGHQCGVWPHPGQQRDEFIRSKFHVHGLRPGRHGGASGIRVPGVQPSAFTLQPSKGFHAWEAKGAGYLTTSKRRQDLAPLLEGPGEEK